MKQIYQHLRQHDAEYLSLEELFHADKKLSYVLLGAGNRLEACSILDCGKDKHVCWLRQFFCMRNHTAAALPVLQASARAMLSFCPGNAVLEIPTVTDPAVRLVERLLTKEKTCRKLIRAVLDLH